MAINSRLAFAKRGPGDPRPLRTPHLDLPLHRSIEERCVKNGGGEQMGRFEGAVLDKPTYAPKEADKMLD